MGTLPTSSVVDDMAPHTYRVVPVFLLLNQRDMGTGKLPQDSIRLDMLVCELSDHQCSTNVGLSGSLSTLMPHVKAAVVQQTCTHKKQKL